MTKILRKSGSLQLQRVPTLLAFWDLEKIVLHQIRVSGTVLWSPTKGHSFLVWYSIDREDQESESGFLCKKHFFVEKTVLIQSAHGAVYLDTNSLLVADVK